MEYNYRTRLEPNHGSFEKLITVGGPGAAGGAGGAHQVYVITLFPATLLVLLLGGKR